VVRLSCAKIESNVDWQTLARFAPRGLGPSSRPESLIRNDFIGDLHLICVALARIQHILDQIPFTEVRRNVPTSQRFIRRKVNYPCVVLMHPSFPSRCGEPKFVCFGNILAWVFTALDQTRSPRIKQLRRQPARPTNRE
jgi:hypothetical protein